VPPTSEFLAGSQIVGKRFKSRPKKLMSYLLQINQLSISARSIPGHEWDRIKRHYDSSDLNGLLNCSLQALSTFLCCWLYFIHLKLCFDFRNIFFQSAMHY
jgi:hypothetical protein